MYGIVPLNRVSIVKVVWYLCHHKQDLMNIHDCNVCICLYTGRERSPNWLPNCQLRLRASRAVMLTVFSTLLFLYKYAIFASDELRVFTQVRVTGAQNFSVPIHACKEESKESKKVYSKNHFHWYRIINRFVLVLSVANYIELNWTEIELHYIISKVSKIVLSEDRLHGDISFKVII